MGDSQFSPDADPSNPEAAAVAEPQAALPDAQAQLAEALAEAERLRAEWLRAKAETENTRRRSQEDVAKAHKFGIESFAASLLGVKDGLEATLALENAGAESLRQGVELTARQLDAVLERFAVKSIEPAAGDKFDPHRHQSISPVESDREPNTIVAVLQRGYLLHDRVLRPALVTVAKAREGPGAIDKPPQ